MGRRALIVLTACTGPPDVSALDTAPEPVSDVVLVASGVIPCADPEARLSRPFDALRSPVSAPPFPYLAGAGSVIADLDGDQLLDLVIVAHDSVTRFRQLDDHQFGPPDPLITIVPPTEVTGLFGGTAADPDGDGDLDLFITGYGVPNRFLRNDGGSFSDATDATGLAGPPTHHSASSAWADRDGDGDLDLFVAGHGFVDEAGTVTTFGPADPSLLYDNQGDGTFVERPELLDPDLAAGYSFVGGWIDIDADNDLDLYVVNDFGASQEPCRLLVADDGHYTLDKNQAGIDRAFSGMGLAIGDMDGDGFEDLAVPAWAQGVLFTRRSDSWFDIGAAAGLSYSGARTVGWGSRFADLDNDGDLDLLTGFGFIQTNFGHRNGLAQPDSVHQQIGAASFAERAADWGLADGSPNRGFNTGDLNDDGWPDLVTVGLDGTGTTWLSRCGTAGWLRVRLEQPGMNRFGIGARIEVTAGARTQPIVLRAGGTGYGVGGPPEAHIGLGSAMEADLVVRWPDGRVDRFDSIAARQIVTVRRSN